MKYVNANQVFPEHLLNEMQKYVQGVLIYIPNPEGVKKGWGEASGSRRSLRQRNMQIRECFQNGHSICDLSKAFFLSYDSVKKIVYSNK